MAWNQRIPSTNSLARLRRCDAKLLRKALEALRDSGVRSGKQVMEVASALCGDEVQSLWPEMPHISYLNTGDTYKATLIYNSRTGSLSVGAWGDLFER